MEELMTGLRYTVAISAFALSMLLMFRMGAEHWAATDTLPDPEPPVRRKSSPRVVEEMQPEPESPDAFSCQVSNEDPTTIEWRVKYQ